MLNSSRKMKDVLLTGTPVLDMLDAHCNRERVGFHMPGHKSGMGIGDWLRQKGGLYDVTELPDTDNLHHATDAIARSEELTARVFGAWRSFHLVNGSTCGVLAMLQAATEPRDTVLIGRDAHKSVLDGIQLCQLRPIFLMPIIRESDQLPLGLTAEQIETALLLHPEIKAVFITRPNYYGICSDIKQIAAVVKKAGKVLLVDEAHGAHFRFHSSLPNSAVEVGVDAVVQSFHKTLPSLTQTAVMHIPNGSVFCEHSMLKRLKMALSTFQTSSPSFVLLASIDAARDAYARNGQCYLEGQISQISELKDEIYRLGGVEWVAVDNIVGFEKDMTRVVLNARAIHQTGWALERHLRLHGILVEMADSDRVVLITTPYHTNSDYQMLIEALSTFIIKDVTENAGIPIFPKTLLVSSLPMHVAVRQPSRVIPISEALGQTAADFIVPYPPGIPILVPGEVMNEEVFLYLQSLLAGGAVIHGVTDGCVHIISSETIQNCAR